VAGGGVTTYDDTLSFDGDWTYYGAVLPDDEIRLVVEIDVTNEYFTLVEDEEFTGAAYNTAFEYEDPDGPVGVGTPINYAGEQLSWTDITALVQDVTINRGKPSTTFSGFEAGSCTVNLIDENADFIPSNPAGAYYPNIRPMRPIRISAVFSGTSTRLFRGYVDSWGVQFDPILLRSFVSIQATDGFKILSTRNTTVAGVDGDTPGERVADILDDVLWPTGLFREIDASGWSSPLAASDGASTAGLTALQDVEFAEAGALYLTGKGSLRFLNRKNTYRSGYDWVFDGGGTIGAITYEDTKLDISDDVLANVLTLTNVNDEVATVENGFSKDLYEFREFTRNDVLTETLSATENLAYVYSLRDALPLERIASINVNGRKSLANMNLIVSYELMDKAQVTLAIPGGYSLAQTVYLTSVSHSIRPGEWNMEFSSFEDFLLPQEWQDLDDTLAWEDVGATVTWLQVAEGAERL
jgi:hypothetical protein